MAPNRRASSATPTSDWLITAVGPPPWATRIFPDAMVNLLQGARWDVAVSGLCPDSMAPLLAGLSRRIRFSFRGHVDDSPVALGRHRHHAVARWLRHRCHDQSFHGRAKPGLSEPCLEPGQWRTPGGPRGVAAWRHPAYRRQRTQLLRHPADHALAG